MYSARMRLAGLGYAGFVGLTLTLLVITWMIFRVWRVEIAGRWTTGQVVEVTHCRGRYNAVLSTVILTVSFTDHQGAHHTSQTDCQYDTIMLGDPVSILYVSGEPSYILTQQDIGMGQGHVLAVVVVVDVLCVTLATLLALLMVRASRRGQPIHWP